MKYRFPKLNVALWFVLLGLGSTLYVPSVVTAQSGLADTFDGSTLDPSWQLFGTQHLSSTDPIVLEGGQLKLHCTSDTPWFKSDRAFLMYKELTGPFDISTIVRVRKHENQDEDTDSGYRFGGLMIRNAGFGYKFIVVGRRSSSGNQIETKNTTFPGGGSNGESGVSAFDTPDGEQESELRLVRDASGTVTVYSRPIGSSVWQERAFSSSGEPDLGNVNTDPVQLGLIVYGLSGSSPDFVGIFDEVADVGGSGPGSESPVLSISSPTTQETYVTADDTLSLGGTASDDQGVVQVTWSSSTGASGTAGGTNSWSVPAMALQVGENVITVTAEDADGNMGSDTLSVTRQLIPEPPGQPQVN